MGTTLGALAVLLATGCSSGDPVVESEELAREVTSALAEQDGQEPDEVSCPDDLPVEAGESVRCEVTAGGTAVVVTVTVSAVDGTDPELDVRRMVNAGELARKVSGALTERTGQEPDDVSCPDDLPAAVGESVRCEVTAGGTAIGVTVTASAVDGADVELDIQVDDAPVG